MRQLILFVLLLWSFALKAQSTEGLVAYYPVDTALVDATGNSSNAGFTVGRPGYVCGVQDQAIALNGGSDQIRIVGPVTEEFDTEDFSVSFYFKPVGFDGTQYLLSKRGFDCTQDKAFFIRYQASTKSLNVYLGERSDKNVNIVTKLEAGTCWYHVVVVREATKVRVYVNGTLRQEQGTIGRADIFNDGDLIIGGSDCFATSEVPFRGLMDDIRFYNQALDELEIAGLYFSPDKILTRDTVIFLGNSVDIELGNTCATNFQWSPAVSVNSPFEAMPSITPAFEGNFVYQLQMTDNVSTCTATDSIRITVVNPDNLDCSTAYLPKTFTPNGDGLNDTYGLSNPYAIQDLIALEIFDRWGGRIFVSTSPFERWNGLYRGERVNPGVLLYRIRYVCQGEELEQTGSFMIMK